MLSTEHWLVHEHTQFEVLVKDCRNAIEILDWWAAEQFFTKLTEELRYHMAQEGEVLFPAYDKKSESSHGSTLALYNEHSVIIDGFRQLKVFIDSRASKDAYDSVVDLELLLIEHNGKEEKRRPLFLLPVVFYSKTEMN